ncbi:hypothetical protein D3C71_1539040 [compost metagenome]
MEGTARSCVRAQDHPAVGLVVLRHARGVETRRIGPAGSAVGDQFLPPASPLAVVVAGDPRGVVILAANDEVTAPVMKLITDGDAHANGLVIAFLGQAIGDVALEAAQVRVEDQIDDAGDRVRSPGGGSAAGHGFNAVHHDRRNEVEINLAGRRRGNIASSVDQRQRTNAAQASQVGEILAAAQQVLRVGLRRLAGPEGRYLVQKFADIRQASLLKGFYAQDRRRGRRVETGAGHT